MKKRMLASLLIIVGCLNGQKAIETAPHMQIMDAAGVGLLVKKQQFEYENTGEVQGDKPEKDCLLAYVDLEREVKLPELICLYTGPMLLFCNKLGWPFCCLCL